MARQQKLIHLHGNSDFNSSAVAIDKGEIAVEHGRGAAAVKLWTLDETGAKVAFMSSVAVNAAVADALKDAQEYADQAETDAIASAKTYTDTRELVLEGEITAAENRITALEGKFTGEDSVEAQIEAALESAKGYADDAKEAAISTAAADATSKANAAQAAAEATAAADATSKANAAQEAAQDYADGLAKNYDAVGSAAQALVDAKAYTDTKIADEVTRSNNYADAAEAAAIASANTYTDDEVKTVNDALTAHTSNGDIHVTAQQTTDWQAATDAINAFMDAENVGGAVVDTLKEIQDYITNDGAAADTMTKNIAANAAAIDAIEADYLKAADKTELQNAINAKVAQSAYDTKVAELVAADAANAKAISDEVTRAKAAEADLQAAIDEIAGEGGSLADTLQAAKDYTDDLLGDGFTTVNTVAKAIADLDDDLQGQITALDAAYKAADTETLNSAKADATTKATTAETNAKTYTNEVLGGNYTSANTVTNAFTTAINNAIEAIDLNETGTGANTGLDVTVNITDGKTMTVTVDDSNLVIDCGTY